MISKRLQLCRSLPKFCTPSATYVTGYMGCVIASAENGLHCFVPTVPVRSGWNILGFSWVFFFPLLKEELHSGMIDCN